MTGSFVLAVCLTLWFGGRTAVHAVYWADPKHQNQQIEGWMTLGYVGKSWRVPRGTLKASIDEIWPDGERDRYPPVHRIALETGLSEAEVIARLDAVIATYRAQAAE
ncbi:hypothetical protein MWU54_01770 [Marivita sp. S6314]|uniref:hypothetical protein n=1 Tax=Marivita sp. S6314 TaxID=2926406 RepID=UPI001FF48086|nr:hypothetical protein [Marivita sp. S6314]MCK0148735.1 hypothetical protein [Marivita sp. S6314]